MDTRNHLDGDAGQAIHHVVAPTSEGIVEVNGQDSGETSLLSTQSVLNMSMDELEMLFDESVAADKEAQRRLQLLERQLVQNGIQVSIL